MPERHSWTTRKRSYISCVTVALHAADTHPSSCRYVWLMEWLPLARQCLKRLRSKEHKASSSSHKVNVMQVRPR